MTGAVNRQWPSRQPCVLTMAKGYAFEVKGHQKTPLGGITTAGTAFESRMSAKALVGRL